MTNPDLKMYTIHVQYSGSNTIDVYATTLDEAKAEITEMLAELEEQGVVFDMYQSNNDSDG